ncbi:hypothetical protein N7474_002250 [Penicillium riverlandense]|uniref:uncharacterized protein n=1 Tax=Penicillium riverlandense TaxID=1903569 RepID=UPI0025497BED|nr:uncharacterized protein N7474_002250 [Penicillium riverlandense]KAJ5833939.1 hypothetical protein N7474_002250 [Penicillium riverlandense]
MVSLWPWKCPLLTLVQGEDNSPASFEKTLSTLSTKIAQATARLDQQRQTTRRFKALWTLYSTLAYLFYSIVLALVLGWESWGVKEYAAIGGGPVLIYAVRAVASRFFNYRVSRTQTRLDDLQKQRDETIEKLKVATRYNSTQQLLEKYGGESPQQSPKGGDEKRKSVKAPQPAPVARTGLPPPPTANIRRPSPMQDLPSTQEVPHAPSLPSSAAQGQPQPFPAAHSTDPSASQPATDQPGFAPNAFPNSGQYIEQPHWYDRLLDVLLGEDETQPRNRMAMICNTCRLVNGQAPPGIKTPEELGRWRCGSCGAWNGVESETNQILTTLRDQIAPGEGTWEPVSHAESSDATDDGVMVAASEDDQADPQGSDAELQDAQSEQAAEEPKSEEPVRRSKRGQAKGGHRKE